MTLNAYNASAQEFTKNTEALHPEEQAKHFLQLLPGNRILDLGCGPGRDAEVFVERGHQVTGIDLSPQMIEIARSRVTAQFHVMDMESLDFPPSHFDGIWASASLLHVPQKNIPRLIGNLYSLLVEEGIFYFSLKKGSGEHLQYDPRYGNLQKFWSFFEKEEIEQIVKQTGFEVVKSVISEKKSTYQEYPLWVNVICKKGKN